MRLKGLDLNLLIVLDALLELQSVSRTAERLHLSQPAISSALGRLRDYFGDDILAVQGKRMHPTALAQALRSQVRESLRTIEDLIATSATFEPATTQRTFRVVASDYVAATLLVDLARHLAETAPHIALEIVHPSDDSVALIEDGHADILIAPDSITSLNLPFDELWLDHQVAMGWREHPALAMPVIGEPALLAAGHVEVAMGNRSQRSFGDVQAEQLGKRRRIEVTVASFAMLPWFLIGTHRLAITHERLALAMARHFPLACAALPFELPPMRMVAQYHHARAADDGLAWFRARLVELAAAF